MEIAKLGDLYMGETRSRLRRPSGLSTKIDSVVVEVTNSDIRKKVGLAHERTVVSHSK